MSVDEMREKLIGKYPTSKAWAFRVSRMRDTQIYAVYMRIFTRN